jgi:hypothetical protein
MLVLFCIPCDSGGQASSNLVLSESDRRPHAPHTQRQLTIVQRAMSTLTTSSISDPIWTEHEGNKRSSLQEGTGSRIVNAGPFAGPFLLFWNGNDLRVSTKLLYM